MQPTLRHQRFRHSPMVKLIVIGLMILALLIPLAMIGSTVRERAMRQQEAERNVSASWGLSQTLSGPVLTVPFRVWHEDTEGKVTSYVQKARFFPAQLDVRGTLVPELRHRGIFEVAVYGADLTISGHFDEPDFEAFRIAPKDILWEDATLDLGLSDLRGIRQEVTLAWGELEKTLSPSGRLPGLWDSGLGAKLPELAEEAQRQNLSFSVPISLSGSQRFFVVPAGGNTTVDLDSSWDNPSFGGAFLPQEHRVSKNGFTAHWSVPYYGRSVPQSWVGDPGDSAGQLSASAFGVDLMLAVDTYQKTERARKYGILFLVLTFLTFFLFEVFNPLRLHPMHYLLVGCALTLFFLVLLSLAEHIAFGYAYSLAAGVTVGLIGGYCATILDGRRRATVVTLILAALYGYLFVLLRLQDYALLLGSLALVAILALVMFVTRKVDWFGSSATATAPS